MSSWADVTRGSQANYTTTITTTTNRTSEPVTGYVAPKSDGQRRSPAKKSAHPQHPVAPQHSVVKPNRGKPRGLENTVKRMISRVSPTVINTPAEPVDETDNLLIDLS